MQRLLVFPLLALALASLAPVQAEGEEVVQKLSLEDAVHTAVENHAYLKQAEQSAYDALSRLKIAGLETSYGVGTRATFDRNGGRSEASSNVFGNLEYENQFGTQASIDLSPFGSGSEHGSVSLTLRHPLTQGKGELSAKRSRYLDAQSELAIKEKEVYITRQARVQRVIDAYCGAVMQRDLVKVYEDSLAIVQEEAEGARKRADAGLVAEIEVARAEVEVARARDDLNMQKGRADDAMDRLMLAIGSGIGQSVELTDAVPQASDSIPDLAEAIEVALANRTELAQYDQKLQDQARKLALAQDKLKPGLDLVARFNSQEESSGILSGDIFRSGSLAAGFEYRIPLDKRILNEEKEITERGLEVLREIRLYSMETIAGEVRDAYRSYESAKTSLEIAERSLRVAEENLHLAKRMVEEDLRDNRNVLEAERSLTNLKGRKLMAEADLYLAHINLRYAMGEDLTTVVSK